MRLLIALAKAAKEGKELCDLISELEMPQEAIEVRLNFVSGVDFKTLGKTLLKAFTAHAETLPYATLAPDNYEGCRLSFDGKHGDGWALLRISLHDPVLPINVESNQKHGALKILKDLYYFLRGYEYLDISPMEQAIAKQRQALLNDVKQK